MSTRTLNEDGNHGKHFWFRNDTPIGPYWTPYVPSKPKLVFPNIEQDSIPGRVKAYKEMMENDSNLEFVNGSTGLVMRKFSAESAMPAENPPPGYYRYMPSSYSVPERLMPAEFRANESAVVMARGVFDAVRTDITKFAQNKPKYEQAGAHYRLGILMYGPPGNGKSTLIRQIVSDHPDLKNATKIICSKLPEAHFFEMISKLPGLKVFIFEELSAAIGEHNENLSDLLNFLDGDASVQDGIVIATTNYPESLPGNIVDRPSRFDKMYKFGLPSEEERKLLLAKLLSREATESELEATKGLSVAYVKESAMRVIIDGLTLEEAVKQLKDRMKEIKKAFSDREPLGLGISK